MKQILSSLMLIALLAGPAVAGGDWLHVRVEERGPRAEKVSVNVPMQMIEAFVPMIESHSLHHGRIRLDGWDDGELDGLDLREIFEALQASPDANFVTVQSDDERVRVAKEKGFLVVNVDDRHDKEQVRVRIPLDVVEALLSGEDDELDLLAALRQLAAYGGDLITIDSDDAHVRIWIDDNEEGE